MKIIQKIKSLFRNKSETSSNVSDKLEVIDNGDGSRKIINPTQEDAMLIAAAYAFNSGNAVIGQIDKDGNMTIREI